MEMKYHGHHIFSDYVGDPISSDFTLEISPKIEKLILILLKNIGIECVGHTFKIFDGTKNPTGIASTFTLSDSHSSFHMYSDYEGKCLIAIDIFTCNLTPELTTEFYNQLNKYILTTFPNIEQQSFQNIKRFPFFQPLNKNDQDDQPKKITENESFKYTFSKDIFGSTI